MVERQSHVSLGEPRSLLLPPLAQIGSRVSARHRRVSALLLVAAALLTLIAACGGAGSRLPPAAPGAVTATPIAGGIRVTWDDLSDNESEFVVYRSDADAAEDEEGHELTEVARVPNDTVSYQDFGVTMGGSYLYAVASANQFGLSEQVLQEPAEPVSPAVGVRLTITLDGVGHVAIDDGFSIVTCSSPCVHGVASAAAVALPAVGSDDTAFAGWSGACGGAGTCRLTPTGDVDVEARFTTHVLLLVATGDSPVAVEVSPPDSFNSTACVLGPGESCAFGYDFGAALKVSVNSEVVEASDGAVFVGYDGACTSPQGRFCLIDVDGGTEVEIEVIRSPVVAEMSYETLEDDVLEVAGDGGLLTGVSDTPGDVHTALLESEPANGSLSLNPDGSFTYTPDADYFGTDSFEFRARDAHGNVSQAATATVAVTSVNDAPRFELAGNPPATVGHGNPVGPIAFATGLHPGADNEAGQTLTFDITPVSGADLVTGLTVDISGTSASLTYTPVAGTYGTATYEVRLKDSGGTANGGADTSAPQTLTITVSPVTLTVTSTAGGTLAPAPGVHEYGYGTNVTVTASPSANYEFAGWTGACTGSSSSCEVAMTGNRTVNASFAAFVRVRPQTFFFVNSSPTGINGCASINFGTCDHAFVIDTEVTLTVNQNRTFSGVTCTQGTPTTACTFTVTGPIVVTVE